RRRPRDRAHGWSLPPVRAADHRHARREGLMALAFHHIALNCEDPLAIERWYTKHFGFERKRVYLPGPGQVVVIGTDGLALELFPAQGAPPSGPPDKDGPPYRGHRHVAFLVHDLDAKLREMG